jgi:hypothetical protein
MANIEKVQFVSGEGLLIYNHLITARDYQNNGQFKKSTSLVVDGKDVEVLKDIINNLWKEGKLKSTAFNPLKSGNEYNKLRVENGKSEIECLKDKYMITFKTNADFNLRIVNGQRKDISTDESIDSNCWYGRLIGKLGLYTTGTGGITCYLSAVQLLREATDVKIGGDISQLFDYVETEQGSDELPF